MAESDARDLCSHRPFPLPPQTRLDLGGRHLFRNGSRSAEELSEGPLSGETCHKAVFRSVPISALGSIFLVCNLSNQRQTQIGRA